jgi:hypothetical protein
MANRFFPNSADYKITSRFGMRKNPVSGVRKMHNGIDLVGKNSNGVSCTDHITAHTGGVVSAVGYNSSAGYYVQIKVGDNTVMVYYHLKAMSSLRKGVTVKKGAVIGYMGSSGNSTGAHLHWGIKRNGSWIDPEPYLDKDYEEGNTVDISVKVLKRGAKGATVKALQALLIGYGYSCGNSGADGSFGAKTEEAVMKFQDKHGLTKDGSVGRATWSELLGV